MQLELPPKLTQNLYMSNFLGLFNFICPYFFLMLSLLYYS